MTILEIRTREALNRQIPRLFARFGYKVRKLTCIRVGKITTKGMRVGEYRQLRPDEIKHLQKLAEKAEATTDGQTTRRGDKEQRPRPRHRRGNRPGDAKDAQKRRRRG